MIENHKMEINKWKANWVLVIEFTAQTVLHVCFNFFSLKKFWKVGWMI